MWTSYRFFCHVGALTLATLPLVHSQETLRALPDGKLPDDQRLSALRTLDDYSPFTSVADRASWEKRSEALRRQVKLANGLWPMPSKTPLRAVVHGLVDRDDYTVENVFFESMPGHFVTGSLYRPKGRARGTRSPGVITPHGHWANGRFHDHGEEEMKKEMASGAEKFDPSGRHPLQARCVQLARMGCVVFHYDMLGYADSQQLAHRPADNDPKEGFFSVNAELRQQTMMGLQTYNSVRALDFLTSLDDVDPTRIGVTGASGGGTQTMMVGAVDDRPAALFPAVMVSTGMQGGCTCENCNYLRINGGNIDVAALAAPRPLGMTAANDWTVEIETKGKPDLVRLYTMLGIPDRLQVSPFLQFGHNYNAVSREAMYHFMNKHLGLGQAEPVKERDFKPLSTEELSVWDDAHPAPRVKGPEHERALHRWWASDSDNQLAELEAAMGDDAESATRYQEIVGGAWATIIGRKLSEVGTIDFELVDKKESDGATVMTGLLTNKARHEQVPALFAHPIADWNGEVIILLDAKGKSVLLEDGGRAAKALVSRGYSVMSIDTLNTGEFLANGQALTRQPMVGDDGKNALWKQSSAYTFGYNAPLFSKRVHDVLTAISFVKDNPNWDTKRIHLAGKHEASLLVLGALSQSEGAVSRAMIHSDGVRFSQVTSWDDPWFVPGASKYRDLPGLLASCAPTPVLVFEEEAGDVFAAEQAYLGTNAADQLKLAAEPSLEAILAWLK